MRKRYLENTLFYGEEVIASAEIHWYYFAVGIIYLIVSAAVFMAFITIPGSVRWESLARGFQTICLLLLCLACFLRSIGMLLKALTMKYTYEFVLTTERVIIKSGLLHITINEIMLSKIEGLSARQPLLGRILDYGDLLITTGGVEQVYPKIKNVLAFHNNILEQMAHRETRSQQAAADASANTVQMVAQLQKNQIPNRELEPETTEKQ